MSAKRPTLYWGDRVKQVFNRSGMRAVDYAAALDTDYNTFAAWMWRGTLPLLSNAVRVSNRTGFGLARLISAHPLPESLDFAPRPQDYEHGSWPKGLRLAMPGLTDNAISRRISDRSLIPERVPHSWLYDLEVPLLSSAVEAARALDIDLDQTLVLGRSS